MTCTQDYTIADLGVRRTEPHLVFPGLAPFRTSQHLAAPLREVRTGTIASCAEETLRPIDRFDFPDADADCRLTRCDGGYLFEMTVRGTERRVRLDIGDHTPLVVTDAAPDDDPALFRFGLWMAFNIRAAAHGVAAIHSSVLVHAEGAVLCLGESGTGKSTHTRLWREHIPGTGLLNDDSPLVAVRDGRALVYGSPWSGKTPCYRNERYPIRAFMRLAQAPENRIRRLPVLLAYTALQPSFPPSFMHEEPLADRINALLSALLARVPVYRLDCLPDAAAARLARATIYPENER